MGRRAAGADAGEPRGRLVTPLAYSTPKPAQEGTADLRSALRLGAPRRAPLRIERGLELLTAAEAARLIVQDLVVVGPDGEIAIEPTSWLYFPLAGVSPSMPQATAKAEELRRRLTAAVLAVISSFP